MKQSTILCAMSVSGSILRRRHSLPYPRHWARTPDGSPSKARPHPHRSRRRLCAVRHCAPSSSASSVGPPGRFGTYRSLPQSFCIHMNTGLTLCSLVFFYNIYIYTHTHRYTWMHMYVYCVCADQHRSLPGSSCTLSPFGRLGMYRSLPQAVYIYEHIYQLNHICVSGKPEVEIVTAAADVFARSDIAPLLVLLRLLAHTDDSVRICTCLFLFNTYIYIYIYRHT